MAISSNVHALAGITNVYGSSLVREQEEDLLLAPLFFLTFMRTIHLDIAQFVPHYTAH